MFNARTQNLWLGRRRRCASDAQRIALMVRDKACVGCGADANRSFAHHIDHWRNGGGTDYPNLVTVCNDCHHDIHERHHQVEQDRRTGKHRVVPPPEAFPDTGTTTWQPKQLNPVLRN
ncbi:MAG: HNH endonuclease signature motif containing protein [bacterium]|nr:HNH endonuclease signature motif containing protein [bacterium]